MAILVARGTPTALTAAGPFPAQTAPGLTERLSSVLGSAWTRLPELTQSFDSVVAAAWILGSAVLALALVGAYRRLIADRPRWGHATIDGQAVRLSGDVGPAVVGVARTEVVLPRWVLEAGTGSRRLILLHEIEHLRAGDARLLFAGLVVAVAMPWNVFAWMQLRRLRLAVEYDCDERVLRRGVPVREYATLLFDASRDALKPHGLATAFVQFDSQLGRRIRKMTEKRQTPRYLPATVAGCAAAALVFVACQAPTPTEATFDDAAQPTIRLDKSHGELTAADKEALHGQLKEIGEDIPFGETVLIESADGNTWEVDPNHNVLRGDEQKLAEFKKQVHESMLQEGAESSFIHREGTDGTFEVVDFGSGDDVAKVRTEHPSGELHFQGDGEFEYKDQAGTLQRVELTQLTRREAELKHQKQQAELKLLKESDVGQF